MATPASSTATSTPQTDHAVATVAAAASSAEPHPLFKAIDVNDMLISFLQ
jgi:hypothetical protein